MALEAFEFTGGLFNPMVLNALSDAGYSSSFETVRGGKPRERADTGSRVLASTARACG